MTTNHNGRPRIPRMSKRLESGIPRHLDMVGPSKPMGYVFNEGRTRERQDDIARLLAARGIDTMALPEHVWVPHKSYQELIDKAQNDMARTVYMAFRDRYVDAPVHPLLVAYDELELKRLVDANLEIMEASGWDNTSTGFIKGATHEGVPAGTPLHQLVSYAFGDERFPLDRINIPVRE